jgi:hypothetical protein
MSDIPPFSRDEKFRAYQMSGKSRYHHVKQHFTFLVYDNQSGLWTAISSRLVFMTRTAKDSPYRKQRFLDVFKKADGSYDLFLDDSPIRTNIPEEWLESEVCRFGFCGEEYRSILREVSLHGRTRLTLSTQWRPNA